MWEIVFIVASCTRIKQECSCIGIDLIKHVFKNITIILLLIIILAINNTIMNTVK